MGETMSRATRERIARILCARAGHGQSPCTLGVVDDCPVGRGTSDASKCMASNETLIMRGFYETADEVIDAARGTANA